MARSILVILLTLGLLVPAPAVFARTLTVYGRTATTTTRTATRTVPPRPVPRPDLAALDLQLAISPIGALLQLANRGAASAPAFLAAVHLTSTTITPPQRLLVGLTRVPALRPGQSLEKGLLLAIPARLADSIYLLELSADPLAAVVETGTANNTRPGELVGRRELIALPFDGFHRADHPWAFGEIYGPFAGARIPHAATWGVGTRELADVLGVPASADLTRQSTPALLAGAQLAEQAGLSDVLGDWIFWRRVVRLGGDLVAFDRALVERFRVRCDVPDSVFPEATALELLQLRARHAPADASAWIALANDSADSPRVAMTDRGDDYRFDDGDAEDATDASEGTAQVAVQRTTPTLHRSVQPSTTTAEVRENADSTTAGRAATTARYPDEEMEVVDRYIDAILDVAGRELGGLLGPEMIRSVAEQMFEESGDLAPALEPGFWRDLAQIMTERGIGPLRALDLALGQGTARAWGLEGVCDGCGLGELVSTAQTISILGGDPMDESFWTRTPADILRDTLGVPDGVAPGASLEALLGAGERLQLAGGDESNAGHWESAFDPDTSITDLFTEYGTPAYDGTSSNEAGGASGTDPDVDSGAGGITPDPTSDPSSENPRSGWTPDDTTSESPSNSVPDSTDPSESPDDSTHEGAGGNLLLTVSNPTDNGNGDYGYHWAVGNPETGDVVTGRTECSGGTCTDFVNTPSGEQQNGESYPDQHGAPPESGTVVVPTDGDGGAGSEGESSEGEGQDAEAGCYPTNDQRPWPTWMPDEGTETSSTALIYCPPGEEGCDQMIGEADPIAGWQLVCEEQQTAMSEGGTQTCAYAPVALPTGPAPLDPVIYVVDDPTGGGTAAEAIGESDPIAGWQAACEEQGTAMSEGGTQRCAFDPDAVPEVGTPGIDPRVASGTTGDPVGTN